MSPIACPSQDMLFAFAVGELPEPELTEVAEHLDLCIRCGEQASRLDRATDPILVGLKLIGDAGLRTLIAAQVTEGRVETEDVSHLAETWGDFRIVREIGRGGMGVVYEAFQESLNRHVAVKLLREPADLARFRREARAAGRLHHTNIVPVHGVGEHAGRHYYVMQYIVGRGLDQALRRPRGADEGEAGPAVDYREAAQIALQAAEALTYAHDQGILHRDIKPSNILLDERGTVWITDFGLAYDTADTQTLTHTGDLLGTLRYMAPERFAGRSDAGADVYGLGATLYELATGRPAFPDGDRAVLIHRVLHEDPPRLRQVDPRMPRDLETIILKAMAREPLHRYAMAAEMAEDLRRFVEDRPIRARRVGAWERGARWCRRNPLVAGLLAGLVVVFLAGFAAVTVLWRRADAEARRANKLSIAEAEAREAESRRRIQAQAENAARDFDRGLDLARRGDGDLAMPWMVESLRKAPPEQPALARMVRANLEARAGSSPRLRAILEHQGVVNTARFRADGRVILTGGADGTARLWSAATGEPIGPPMIHGGNVSGAVFSPDGRRVLTGGNDGRILSWSAATGQLDGPPMIHGVPIWSLEFTRDGRLFLSWASDSSARIWETATGRPIGLPIGADTARDAHFSPDGRLVLAAGGDGQARLWNVDTRQLDGPALRHGGALNVARFSPDGARIVTGSVEGTAWLWETATRRPIRALPRHDGPINGAAFSPDGRLVVVYDRKSTALIWDAVAGRPRGVPVRADGEIWYAEFSPDGRSILTGAGNTARLWDADTGRPIGAPMRHGRFVPHPVFSPDGKLVATATADGTAKIWEVDRCELDPTIVRPDVAGETDAADPPRHGAEFIQAAFSPDRSHILLWGNQGVARLIETATGQTVGLPLKQRWSWLRAAAFSPNGRHAAISSHDVPYHYGGSTAGTCRIWDAATGCPASPLLPQHQLGRGDRLPAGRESPGHRRL
jgi:WD40 repeat protein/predicted Ser/Thr protein kinase